METRNLNALISRLELLDIPDPDCSDMRDLLLGIIEILASGIDALENEHGSK